MKEILYQMFDHRNLTRAQAREVLLNISDGKYNDCQLSAFMTVFLMRSITTEELSGFRDALLERRVAVDLDASQAIDIVGTGGDGKNTFNISTATCFVVAGAGYRVIKHGNYGASSVSGASNVLEAHGVRFTDDIDRLRRSFDRSGVCYLHAPFFSPALKSVGGVRRALGVRTFFNMLGPLVNPVMPRHQLLGVYNLKLLRLYHYICQQNGIDCTIVHSLDGYDEVSLTSDVKVASPWGKAFIRRASWDFPRTTLPSCGGVRRSNRLPVSSTQCSKARRVPGRAIVCRPMRLLPSVRSIRRFRGRRHGPRRGNPSKAGGRRSVSVVLWN